MEVMDFPNRIKNKKSISRLSIVVLLLGLLSAGMFFKTSLLFLGWSVCFYILAVFLGIVAVKDIQKNGKTGMSLIIIGLIVGVIPLIMLAFGLVVLVRSANGF